MKYSAARFALLRDLRFSGPSVLKSSAERSTINFSPFTLATLYQEKYLRLGLNIYESNFEEFL